MRVKGSYFHGILVLAFVITVLVSCIPLTPAENPKEVVIQTSRHGHITNATLVFVRDGLNGTWNKLTGTGGVYKFTVNDPSGLYSVAVAEPSDTYSATKVFFIHYKLLETNFVPVDVGNATDEDEATLTINLPSDFATNTQLGIFFLIEHRFPSIDDVSGNKVAVAEHLPKGKGDLVIYYPSLWSEEGVQKVAILRNFELYTDKTINLSTSDFKDSERINRFEDIFLDWLVGGKTAAFGVASHDQDHKIPSSLKNDTDLYVFDYFNWKEGFTYSEYRKAYPTTTPFATSSITPAELPETLVATEVMDGTLKATITPYNPGLSGMSDILYLFRVTSYYELSEGGYPNLDTDYYVKISKGYLQALENDVYTFPVISSTEFQPYNIDLDANIIAGDEDVISANMTLKDFFVPKDGLKILKWFYAVF
ncbi:hypothetical protein [Fervidobacterium nodosum]|uniref:Lipoprotein n=1 Tax=Fervidobacterium nodosum (strain ATCC 35602 / DSM 5306 / Rt17-B1) TaxID=381764 RepID=A7HJ48_FERNB|nr:hypothetical protein [Fervidobacterium nodosum]ABS59931.1 hypothetical protein Fnod_0062 [Fervidobacterium nodosum Rt17-B1]